MKSFQNLVMLQNLYRLRALGVDYIDPMTVNIKDDQTLPLQMIPLQQMIAACHLCDLSKSRSKAMTGFGNPEADVMIIDAYVSMADDESGAGFSGRSGATLRKMVENVLQIPYEAVFLTHAVKCKPAGTKVPSASEWQTCSPYLFKQIELVKPKVIITLGPDAYRMLTDDESAFEQVRGQKIAFGPATLVPIYHPQHLLRNPSQKQVTFHDLLNIKSCL